MPNPENLIGQGFQDHPERINRKGRNKLPDLKQVMADILGQHTNGKTALERIVDKLQELADKGNLKAAEMLLARGYGLPKETKDVNLYYAPLIIDDEHNDPNTAPIAGAEPDDIFNTQTTRGESDIKG